MTTKSILDEIVKGRRMTDKEFLFLHEQASLLELGQAADRVRKRVIGHNQATFIIDRNINYTNICSCQCKFCAFFRAKDHPEAYVIDRPTLLEKIEEAVALGATQLMIQGGMNEDLGIEYFEEMFKSIKAGYDITIHSLTAPEIVFIAEISGLSIKETLLRLKEAGLDSLPGGGAEILHDDIRKAISPNKIMTRQWLEVMKTAHQVGLESTATMMMGSVEGVEHRLYHIARIRDLQDETGGFRAFIAWTYQPGNNQLLGKKITSALYLRFLALSRLYLDNIKHIQGSWVTQGERIGQLTLYFGADDLGSIMLEENVVRAAGTEHSMELRRMVEMIGETGRQPALRNTEYQILKVF